MLKKIGLFILGLTTIFSFGQDEMPSNIDDVITWNFEVTYPSCDEALITMRVSQKNGWHIYSQVQPDGAIPMPTEFTYQTDDNFSLVGKTNESGAELIDNDGFPERSFHGKKAKFWQKIKIKSKEDFNLKMSYGYMACKTACLPPEFRDIELKIKGTDNIDCDEAGKSNQEDLGSQDEEADDEDETSDDNVHNDLTEATGIDSNLTKILNTCEGSNYSNSFQPVVIKSFDPFRTDEKSYSITVEIQIDSTFAMYAFDNPKGLKSAFEIQANDQIQEIQPYTLDIEGNVGTESNGYKYLATIKQAFTIKDTANVPTVLADLDIYLMGCENDFKNAAPTQLSFNLAEAVDNGNRSSQDSLLIIFIIAFLSGFIALLTPCVFPMIPMTVSFFTKQSKTKAEGIRKAIFYAVSIVLIYVILGVLVTAIAGPTILNDMATNPWVNLVFFIMFVVFAISFLGAFEITLPASWVNKADKQADRGGLIGIFFMAFTLALVSFSCTGPIVGTVLVQSAEGGLSGPIVAMLGFSIALALPFGLFAAFPGWLNSLPSSGGWLNTVKVVLGFVELALALKFLSNADLVLQLHMIERELFLGIWIGIFIVLFIYLLGKINFPHDSPVQKLSVGRGIFATFVMGFIIYLMPGMVGAPLKIISGFPPPMTYSESPYGIHGHAPEIPDGWPESTHAHGHGINTIRDYEDALNYAKSVDKPLLLDFTGWACVNCRKMEEYVWADPEVAPIMAEDFVIASLYVDERSKLPKKYEGELKADGEPMETVGDKWMKMEIERYGEVTQPLYVVLDHKENNISGKANYQTHADVELFKEWLENAKTQFKASKNATIIKPQFVLK
ncbi:protein-disulfide reductase DsbD family protein [Crocinitomix algicola]|uniref:protein-disulfide reductase DsbD family protein n=1 Tax=Crocinitomix algicola TaxID=1740263 RepID=UPI0008734475|nr:cytochrome c biogenesis protein CcdA [Crocinitomix algicola]